MKLFVVDFGWEGASIFMADNREEAIKKYWAKHPLPSDPRSADMIKRDVDRITEYELRDDLWINTEGE